MKRLTIKRCQGDLRLATIPSGITRLSIYDCPDLKNLVGLPESVSNLEIHKCPSFESLEGLPDGLRAFTLESLDEGSNHWSYDLSLIPRSVTTLDLSGLSHQISIEGLPEGLKTLRLWRLPRIRDLGVIPDGIRELSVLYCDKSLVLPFREELETLFSMGPHPVATPDGMGIIPGREVRGIGGYKKAIKDYYDRAYSRAKSARQTAY